jgi:hypothetical protein
MFNQPALDEWLRGIRHDDDGPSANPVVRAVHRGMLFRAARWFAMRYYVQHGRLPEGTHHVDCSFGPSGDSDLRHPMAGSGPSRVQADITYPPAPDAAVSRCRTSPR